MDGKVCVVTGATGALGEATAVGLAKRGATVVMVARERGRGEVAQTRAREASGSASIELEVGDLSSSVSVRDLARRIRDAHPRLPVLVNAAAVYRQERTVTADAIETMFATNHLGPFLLTNLLLENLRAAAPSRIVNISAPSTSEIDFDDPQGERSFRPLHAFGASKMANLLFTFDLARRLEGSGVTCNVLHPGQMRSGLMREAAAPIRALTKLMSGPPEKGAGAVVHLASAPELERTTGRFFKRTRPAEASPYARDPQVQRRLWEVSETLAGLRSRSGST